MKIDPLSINSKTTLVPAQDFYRLRQEGIENIEKIGSDQWTDYNAHDPGITILEACCYAITELSYCTDWHIKDLLKLSGTVDIASQPFFTANNILTTNPWTVNDIRKVLIDSNAIRNAWLTLSNRTDLYYAWVDEGKLIINSSSPVNPKVGYQIINPKGIYDVLLELENDIELGDLNLLKLENNYYLPIESSQKEMQFKLELHFPDWDAVNKDELIDSSNLLDEALSPNSVKVNVHYNKQQSNSLNDEELQYHWANNLYANFEVVLSNAAIVEIKNVSVMLLSNKIKIPVSKLIDLLSDVSTHGFIPRYFQKLIKRDKGIQVAKEILAKHRNLGEDYSRVSIINIEEVAVCGEIILKPEADVELVQACLWQKLEQYFNPDIHFYNLQEMQKSGIATENIFNGPSLKHGFIKQDEFNKAEIVSALHTSDIVNFMMDVDGVIAVNNLLLTKYDQYGQIILGAADPSKDECRDSCDPNQASAEWVLFISQGYSPRLYVNRSQLNFTKNGLTIFPDQVEANEILNQLRGIDEHNKITDATNDLPMPLGIKRNLDGYYPIQYALPRNYGVSTEGLSPSLPLERQAKAKQLKAYLMFFEQLMANAFSHLIHTADLFSISSSVTQTYFFTLLDDVVIKGCDELKNRSKHEEFTLISSSIETKNEFLIRRNKFLDHIMARFSESFNDYTLMIMNREGKQKALDKLAKDKITFLNEYTDISTNRNRAANNKSQDKSTLQKRIKILLGNEAALDQLIMVEHLLLRPKFPGDAIDFSRKLDDCCNCTSNDSYSFMLTILLPDDLEIYSGDLELRRFYEKTIYQELPAHLLGKVCWVTNGSFIARPTDEAIDYLVEILAYQFSDIEGNHFAQDIYRAFSIKYEEWSSKHSLHYFRLTALKLILFSYFKQTINLASSTLNLSDELQQAIYTKMTDLFSEVALNHEQYYRFESVWNLWQKSDALFDWKNESILEKVKVILQASLISNNLSSSFLNKYIDETARAILYKQGMAFYQNIQKNLEQGRQVENITVFAALEIDSDNNFTLEGLDKIKLLLEQVYQTYQIVSYRLTMVIELLQQLRNSYPGGVLHDCQVPNDGRFISLNNTALGCSQNTQMREFIGEAPTYLFKN